MFDNGCFTSNVLPVEHPNFLGRRTTYLRFQLSNNIKSNIPTVAVFFSRKGKRLWKHSMKKYHNLFCRQKNYSHNLLPNVQIKQLAQNLICQRHFPFFWCYCHCGTKRCLALKNNDIWSFSHSNMTSSEKPFTALQSFSLSRLNILSFVKCHQGDYHY